VNPHHPLERRTGKAVVFRRRRFFQKSFRSDSRCPTRALKIDGMKTSSTRYRRPTLLPVPYSTRPDRIERGLRALRALRQSLAASTTPARRPQQCEFHFPFGKRA
jgi:hypothetical protein